MKTVIIGAGELGRLLSLVLYWRKHDITVVDHDVDQLNRLAQSVDVKSVLGSCTSVKVLKEAEIEHADFFLAISGNEAANIISCKIASKFNPRKMKRICRLYSSDSFSEEDGVKPNDFGIHETFSTSEEVSRQISAVLDNRYLLEKILFGQSGALDEDKKMQMDPGDEACMATLKISGDSKLLNTPMKAMSLLRDCHVRIATVFRNGQTVFTDGETFLFPGDRIYVAGKNRDVDSFINNAFSEGRTDRGRIVIAGSSDDIGLLLARDAVAKGYEVTLIVMGKMQENRVLDGLQKVESNVIVLYGDPTTESLLEEAGVDSANAFIAVTDDDEANVLSCILAKQQGAAKVIVVTHKPEYLGIVPRLDLIDCSFSTTLTSVNTIFRSLNKGILPCDANLLKFGVGIAEYKIAKKSILVGKRLSDRPSPLPPGISLAFLFRSNGELVSPTGTTVLMAGDTVVTIVSENSGKELEKLFSGEAVK